MMEGGVCDRVGCGELAACALLMAPQDTEAWLVDPDHEAAPDGIGLCGTHADRITVPFGWSFSDDRSPSKPKRKRRAKKTAAAKPSPPPETESPPEVAPRPKPRKASAAAPKPAEKPKTPKTPKTPKQPSSRPTNTEAFEDDVGGESIQRDEPTMQLPAVKVDHPSSPSEVPMNADQAAAGVDAESARLSVVPGNEEADSDPFDFEDDGQGALWAGEPEHEPDESTPLLKRAFRVVRDD